MNLNNTIASLEKIEKLIKYYTYTKVENAYLAFNNLAMENGTVDVHVNRDLVITALTAQRKILVEYLAGLGIDATK